MVQQCTRQRLQAEGKPLVELAASTKEVRAELASLLKTLQRELPVPFKVRLRMVKMKECYGTCLLTENKRDGRHFLINIHPPLAPVTVEGRYVSAETLLHEYAHAMSWSTASPEFTGGHGESWACAYAACYRLIHGD